MKDFEIKKIVSFYDVDRETLEEFGVPAESESVVLDPDFSLFDYYKDNCIGDEHKIINKYDDFQYVWENLYGEKEVRCVIISKIEFEAMEDERK